MGFIDTIRVGIKTIEAKIEAALPEAEKEVKKDLLGAIGFVAEHVGVIEAAMTTLADELLKRTTAVAPPAPPAPPPAPAVQRYVAPAVPSTPATPVPSATGAPGRAFAPLPGTGMHAGCTADSPCPAHGGPVVPVAPDTVFPPAK